MSRFADVTAAVPMSDQETEDRLAGLAGATASPPVERKSRPIACWEIDDITGRPVCRWVIA